MNQLLNRGKITYAGTPTSFILLAGSQVFGFTTLERDRVQQIPSTPSSPENFYDVATHSSYNSHGPECIPAAWELEWPWAATVRRPSQVRKPCPNPLKPNY